MLTRHTHHRSGLPSACLLAFAGSLGGFCGVAHAQSGCFSLSSLGASGALRTSGTTMSTGTVLASTWWDPDGSGPLPEWLVVAGTFNTLDGVAARNVAAWDGTQWRPLGSGLGVVQLPEGTRIETLAVFQGELYAGGRVAITSPSSTTGVWKFDGTDWTRVGSGIALNSTSSTVYALQEFEGTLYAGGSFQIGFAFNLSHVAKLVNGEWQGAGFTPASASTMNVRDLHVHNGQLFASGAFFTTLPGGLPGQSVLRRNGDAWEGIGLPAGAGEVTMMRSEGNDLVFSGQFALPPVALPFARVARFDGTTLTPITLQQTNLGSAVLNSFARLGGDLWMTGSRQLSLLRSDNGLPIASGEAIMAASNTQLDRSLVVLGESDGTRGNLPVGLIVGGAFSQSDTSTDFGLQNWRWLNSLSVFDGTRHTPITRSTDRLVNDLVEYQGKMVAVGTFLSAGGQKMSRIGAFDGDRWSPLDDGTGLNDRGLTAIVWNDKLVVGGIFTQAGGIAAQRVAVWNGTAWEALGSIPEDGVIAFENWSGTLIAYCADNVVRVTDRVPWTLRRWTGTTWELFGGSVENAANTSLTVVGTELYGARTNAPALRWTGVAWEALPLSPLGNAVFVGGTFRGKLSGSDATGARYVFDNGAWRAISTDAAPISFVGVGGFAADGIRLSVGSQSNQFPFANWSAGGAVLSLASGAVSYSGFGGTGTTYTSALRFEGRTFIAGGMIGFQRLVNGQPSVAPAFSMVKLVGPGTVPTFEATESAIVRVRPGEDVSLAVTVRDNTSGTRSWRRNNIAISDGVQADGSIVEGATTDTLVVRNVAYTPQPQLYRLVVLASNTCTTQWLGTQFSVRVVRECDSVDFNNDGMFPDDADLVEFLAVMAGQSCEACNDIDFDNDGLYPNDEDLLAFLRVLAGGAC